MEGVRACRGVCCVHAERASTYTTDQPSNQQDEVEARAERSGILRHLSRNLTRQNSSCSLMSAAGTAATASGNGGNGSIATLGLQSGGMGSVISGAGGAPSVSSSGGDGGDGRGGSGSGSGNGNGSVAGSVAASVHSSTSGASAGTTRSSPLPGGLERAAGGGAAGAAAVAGAGGGATAGPGRPSSVAGVGGGAAPRAAPRQPGSPAGAPTAAATAAAGGVAGAKKVVERSSGSSGSGFMRGARFSNLVTSWHHLYPPVQGSSAGASASSSVSGSQAGSAGSSPLHPRRSPLRRMGASALYARSPRRLEVIPSPPVSEDRSRSTLDSNISRDSLARPGAVPAAARTPSPLTPPRQPAPLSARELGPLRAAEAPPLPPQPPQPPGSQQQPSSQQEQPEQPSGQQQPSDAGWFSMIAETHSEEGRARRSSAGSSGARSHGGGSIGPGSREGAVPAPAGSDLDNAAHAAAPTSSGQLSGSGSGSVRSVSKHVSFAH